MPPSVAELPFPSSTNNLERLCLFGPRKSLLDADTIMLDEDNWDGAQEMEHLFLKLVYNQVRVFCYLWSKEFMGEGEKDTFWKFSL